MLVHVGSPWYVNVYDSSVYILIHHMIKYLTHQIDQKSLPISTIMDKFQTLLSTIFVGLILVLILFTYQSGSFSRAPKSKFFKQTFLILGSNNAGKTSLFYKFLDRKAPPPSTVSSIEPNVEDIKLPFSNAKIARDFQLIDYPGHLKYTQLLQKLILQDITLANLKGICYVVDLSSLNISNPTSLENIATFLFNLIATTEKYRRDGVDFLFAVNKNELFDSTPVNRVRLLLEAEIDKLVQSVVSDKRGYQEEAGDDKDFWLGVIGRPGNPFKFEKLEGNMDFVGGSVTRGKVDGWENWLDERVVN